MTTRPGTATGGGTAARRWAEQLAAWAIPEEILASAPGSPWGFPPEVFARRAEAAVKEPPRPSTIRAREALPRGGSVLDVGCGGGAASLPLADRAGRLVGVDQTASMLEPFREAARAAGIRAETVAAAWPEAAGSVGPADVVVCYHVLYNVPDLPPFALALTDHARARVVVEITDAHPLAWMNPLWRSLHGLERPRGPTADDAEAVLRELGLSVEREDAVVLPRGGGFERREEAVALVRRRLCLSPDRDPDVERALGDRLRRHDDGSWSAGPAQQRVAALWWAGTA